MFSVFSKWVNQLDGTLTCHGNGCFPGNWLIFIPQKFHQLKTQKFLKIPPSKIKIMGNTEKVLVYGSSQELL